MGEGCHRTGESSLYGVHEGLGLVPITALHTISFIVLGSIPEDENRHVRRCRKFGVENPLTEKDSIDEVSG